SNQNDLLAASRNCSRIGPSVSAGKYWSNVTMAIVPSRRLTNNGPSVGNVPAEGAFFVFGASEPAIAMIGTIWANRPKNSVTPVVVLYQTVFALSPAKVEPLSETVDA